MQVGASFISLVGTGQAIIPPGTRAFTIHVTTGSAYVNDVLIDTSADWSYTASDSKCLLASGIAVGCTGIAHRTTILYVA